MRKTTGITVSAVVVAAGRGTRMNMDTNKQYIEICDVPVLARTLEAFENCKLVDSIILVVNEREILYCKERIIEAYGFRKVKSIIAGGAERQNSVYNGLVEVDKDCDIVIIHDGARPFIRQNEIKECINAANEFGAASLAVRVKDTIKMVNEEGMVAKTLDRSKLWAIQTPQAFRLDVIMKAHKQAHLDGFAGTDDAVLVERIGLAMKLVEGSYFNIKITTREDIVMAEAIASLINPLSRS